jgi:hypothetical protein
LPLAIALALSACSSKAKLIAQGGECLQATDCVDGLVCVPQQDGRRICSNDLSGVQSIEEAGPPPAGDAGALDATSDAPLADVEQPDAGPPADTGAPPDAGGGD